MGTKLTRKIRGLNSSFLGKDKWGNALKGKYPVTLLPQRSHDQAGADPGHPGIDIPLPAESSVPGVIPFWLDTGNPRKNSKSGQPASSWPQVEYPKEEKELARCYLIITK
jgi:hypothetical protein